MKSLIGRRQNSKAWSRRHWLSSTYPIHRSADKVNRSGADAQVVSCYSVIFHPFVERLTVFYISGLILQPAALLYPPSPPSQYISGTCQKGT